MTPQPLDSRQLLAFVTLAQTGSFTETARQLSLTQSAISHSIKALERDLGCELCHRLGKKIHLTASGRTLLYMAEGVLRQMAQARSVLDRENEWGGGQIRIGAGPTVCQFLLPAALREFKESFPHCQVVLATADTPDLLQDLELNRIDLAFVLEPRKPISHVYYPIFSDELAFIVPPGHPWALAGRAPKAEIAEQSMLLYSRASYTFRLISRYFREEGVELQSTFELKNTEVLKEMVKI
jgi:DNA-binding transcriptional LysR family regulator